MACGGRFRTAILLLAICATGVLVRVALPAQDFFGQRPLPFPDDAPYHLLRLERLTDTEDAGKLTGQSHSPIQDPAFDHMIAHPFGDQCIWPWGYDRLAAIFIPGDGRCDRQCILRIAGLVPVTASIATGLVVFLLGLGLRRARRRTADPTHGDDLLVPVAATAFFLMMPGNVAYSMAGRFDHHVMEPLFVALPMLLLSSGGTGRMPKIATGGLVLGLGAAFFPAAPAISFPLFVICGFFLADIREAVTWSATMMAGTAISLTASPSPFEWVHYSPSLWHIASVGCISAGLATFHATRQATALRHMWPGSAIGLGAAAGAAAFLTAGALVTVLFPGMADSTFDGIKYTASTNFAALSLEASSIVDDPLRLMALSGWLIPLALVGVYAMSIPGPAGRRRRDCANFVTATAMFIILAAAQRRFLVAASPLIALSAAFGLDFVLKTGPLKAPGGHARTRVLVSTLATLLVLGPSIHATSGMKYLTPLDRAMYAAAETISRSTGEQRGTLAPWGYGHLFKYAADAPTVCDNFFGVPGADAAMNRCLSLLYETDEKVIAETMHALKIRFVVLAPPHPDQIRAETSLLGFNPADWVDSEERLSPLFAKSFFGRTGIWASRADVGATGPCDITLRGRFRQIEQSTGQLKAEVLLLEHVPPQPR